MALRAFPGLFANTPHDLHNLVRELLAESDVSSPQLSFGQAAKTAQWAGWEVASAVACATVRASALQAKDL